ncbi:MAG: Formate--tetrahydrofolate ligase [Candidatus Thorarchaeota archaeon]|nr:MAG: Formate--tetrahydrofolate ligase [Candidatus Thorarchaeota archaeon]
MKHIREVAEQAGIPEEFLEPYGKYMAKIDLSIRKKLGERKGKLILVTATTPTPAGEGKTTNSIGLSMALNALGYKTVVTLREPSLGPVFGVKGGAAGGGKSQVLPSDRINLMFTSDFPAITSAHNLLSAMIDNHVHQDNELGIDVRRVYWPRAMDMNDRALREIVVGLGGKHNGFLRNDRFVITAASEIMAILALATDYDDLKKRLGNILVSRDMSLKEVHAKDLKAEGAMGVMLRDALWPNLVQTSEGTPAIIHTGPFANIAHGTNSVVATDIALRLFDYVVIEAGFGADLGAEKFLNIVTRAGKFVPDTVVILTSIRALQEHGDGDIEAGFPNLEKHYENIQKFGVPAVIALNRFADDTDEEIAKLKALCDDRGWRMEVSEVFAKGGEGGKDLGNAVIETLKREKSFQYTYDLQDDLATKIEKLAKSVYGADGVIYGDGVRGIIRSLTRRGYGELPICVAKTQFSISDNPRLKGRPGGFKVFVRDLDVSAGAGFVVVYMGDVNLMPGLPKEPAAIGMDVDSDGTITGVF